MSKKPDIARLVEAVLTSKNLKEAAEVLGVNPKTLYRWVREPTVRAELDEARRDSLRATLAHMHQMLSRALEAIDRCLDADQPTSVQLAAAKILIENTLRAADAFDLDARLSALEAQRANQPTLLPPFEVKVDLGNIDASDRNANWLQNLPDDDPDD